MLAVAITILVIVLLGVPLSYKIYHTYHGDLPEFLRMVLIVLGIIGLALLTIAFII